MKCYKITFQRLGEPRETKLFTSLKPAIKYWFKIRKLLEWSFGVTQIQTLNEMKLKNRYSNLLEKHKNKEDENT